MDETERQKRLAVTLTVFTEDEELMVFLTRDGDGLISYIEDKLGYAIVSQVAGKHIQANRPHYHICIIYEHMYSWVKTYKALNTKIRSLILPFIQERNMVQEWEHQIKSLKITTCYEGNQLKNGKKYNEDFIRYPLKEYTDDSQIPYQLCRFIHPEKLKILRHTANLQWIETLKRKETETKYKQEQNNKQVKMFQYVVQHLVSNGVQKFEDRDIASIHNLIKKTIIYIIRYLKQEQKNIRLYSIKDLAITILYFHDFIKAEDIVRLINI